MNQILLHFSIRSASLCLLVICFPFCPSARASDSAATASASATPSSQNAEDQFKLGRAYYRGEGVPQSYEKAGEWYRKAADQGNTKAMHNLGIMFLEGKGTRKDSQAGFDWIMDAAKKGDPRSCALVGTLLIKGQGVEKNSSEGILWLRKAADLGDSSALARLGEYTFYGDEGFAKDPKAALPLLLQAAAKGNPWACGTLGRMYEKGQGVSKNLKTAQDWYLKGAELGDPDSQFNHARFLMLESPAKAYPWIKLAVKGRCPSASGLWLECSKGVTPSEISAGDAQAVIIEQAYMKNDSTLSSGATH